MFFSVKEPLKVFGKVYRPCICYAVTKELELTVNKLVTEGKATIYEEKVFFQNGKVLPSVKQRRNEAKAKLQAEKKAKKEAGKEAENEQKAEEEFADSDF